jgi:hypothetical protein
MVGLTLTLNGFVIHVIIHASTYANGFWAGEILCAKKIGQVLRDGGQGNLKSPNGSFASQISALKKM